MSPGDDDQRWVQPGDEVAGSDWDGDDVDPTADEALAGDAEAAAARHRAAFEREADGAPNECPRCGAEVPAGVRRCPMCDALVVAVARCPVCGAQVDVLTPNCPDCGTPNPKYKRDFEL